jgi:hypothetical protein
MVANMQLAYASAVAEAKPGATEGDADS